MARNNYTYEKRQRDLAKKKKKEEKLQRKLEKRAEKSGENQPGPGDDATPETGAEKEE